MSSQLDPSVWNTPITGGSVNQAAGQAGGYAAGLANLNPNVGAPGRTLYDRYSALLQDPTQGMSTPGAQFALKEAQQANQRQLNAGRMRNSGNALRAMSDVTTGTIQQQFGNLANIYGQGAGVEGQRWQQEQGLNLDAQKLKLAGLQGAGDLAIRSGQLYGQQDQTGIAARELDLRRSQANIQTPNQAQASTLYGQAVNQANNNYYGQYSPSLSQQYLNLTGSPLTLNQSQSSVPGSMFSPGYSTSRYY
jgi:hypothetical protein